MEYIWLVFTVIFILLMLIHLLEAKKLIRHIQNKGRIASVSGVETGLKEFAQDFNQYIDELNRTNRKNNLIQATGYFVAALTALFSFFIS